MTCDTGLEIEIYKYRDLESEIGTVEIEMDRKINIETSTK
jgi:hypothetical protein